ncbi:hypothetical protein O6072_23825 [Mycolicibacterium neoaurum]|uniref:hypothetical protein n=1 Tax=Mycolicibacterium neoaurum TaxID=1795 RepID=UPI00248B6174|nr:hypothetical protein [Mycolicibacterium neoaurum]WBP92841.1 hypothetical protein O7W24_16825 [Mycolicibacterium neoaurum]WBS07809.1 hypothetical protein O6072_23825 [Mycolicibacterium neoaurum]
MTDQDADEVVEQVDPAEIAETEPSGEWGELVIDVDDAPAASVVAAGSIRTDAVRFERVSCAGGVIVKFTVPILAFGWRSRLRCYNAQGGFIGQSQIVELNGSYPSGTTIVVAYRGPFIRGTKEIRAYVWYGNPAQGDGTMYWNLKRINC